MLAALPQIRFTPPTPSNYRIRKEPAEHCVATVEALAQVLGALEGDPERFAALRRPFDAMIDTQLHYAKTVRGARQRHAVHRARHPAAAADAGAAARPRRRRRLPARRGERLAGARAGRPPRRRSCTGSRGARAPARRSRRSSRRAGPLAPSIPGHIRIPRERLAARRELGRASARAGRRGRGRTTSSARGDATRSTCSRRRAWRCRRRASTCARPRGSSWAQRTGSVEDCTARLGVEVPDPFALGRGGARLAALSAIVERMMQ